jgi:hypothetical protein
MTSSTQPFDAVLFAGSSPATVGSALFIRSRRADPRRARPISPSVPPVRICRPFGSVREEYDDVVVPPAPAETWDDQD